MADHRLSVIIAGATGSTGRQLVTKLVNHPKVRRVVALSRRPINKDRWTTAFPGIRLADANRHLTVAEMDFARLCSDSSLIQGMTMVDLASRVSFDVEGNTARRAARSSAELDKMLGHKDKTKRTENAGDQGSASSGAAGSSGQRDGKPTDSEIPTEELARNTAINRVCRDRYYRSVFQDHDVAINCLGSHKLGVIGNDGMQVYVEYSLAFATMVRMFDATVGGKVVRMEDNLQYLREALGADSREFQEIYGAVFDPKGYNLKVSGAKREAPRKRQKAEQKKKLVDGSGEDNEVPTLKKFVQVSTAGASTASVLPYFRLHGQRDAALARVFRDGDEQPSPNDDARIGENHRTACDLSIWRPGLLDRGEETRIHEYLLSLMLPPIKATRLAELIVDEVVGTESAAHAENRNKVCGTRPASCGLRQIDVPEIMQLHFLRQQRGK